MNRVGPLNGVFIRDNIVKFSSVIIEVNTSLLLFNPFGQTTHLYFRN